MLNHNLKLTVQQFGRFLSNMVMPNIGAFIAWGLITALFIPTGWWPNESLNHLVAPIITYLLPLLIGYTGGKLIHGERGAVVGAITTMGVIVGSNIPMFLGAMIVGPLAGFAIKYFDRIFAHRVKSGFEMLVNNFSAGIIGMILAIIAYFIVGPLVTQASIILENGVNFMVNNNLLPIVSIIVEPAKILFLNNAFNHGIFSPLGIQESVFHGYSIFFLIEANPGPGLGVLLAYMFFGQGSARSSASGAAIIHFFGGIHEIYFPYVLMQPRLIIALILSGMTGIFTLTLFDAGLTAPASPGSIIAILSMAKGSYVGVLTSITLATLVSFIASAFILKSEQGAEQSLEDAQKNVNVIKNTDATVQEENLVDLAKVKKILVACDAGMGSSAMGAGILRKKVQNEKLDIYVNNSAINQLPNDVDIVITHHDLTPLAKQKVPNAHHISLTNFLDSSIYNNLVASLKTAQSYIVLSNAPSSPQHNSDTGALSSKSLFSLTKNQIFLNLQANDKEEAIRFVGQKLIDLGYVKPSYIDSMLAREQLTSTYLGESIAVPHGTLEAKDQIIKTGIVFCQYPEGVLFGEQPEDKARIVIGIAARTDEHIQVLSKLTNALDDESTIETLASTTQFDDVLAILS